MIRWTSLQILGQKLLLNACVVSYRNIPTTRHLLKFGKGYDCFIWAYTWRVWNAKVNSMGRCRDAGKDWSRRQLQVITKLSPRNWSPRTTMDMDSIHVGSRKKQFFFGNALLAGVFDAAQSKLFVSLPWSSETIVGALLFEVVRWSAQPIPPVRKYRDAIEFCSANRISDLAEQWPMGVFWSPRIGGQVIRVAC